MKTINISLNADQSIGAMQKIAGINNSPTLRWAVGSERERQLFNDLHFSYVRYHDAAIENPQYALIDVTQIFPLFHLDESNPQNYNFAATDDYLALLPADITIDFRLGETIEHSKNHYRIQKPADFEKWASICVNIIRHYKEGWANGYHYDNLKYCSIWEEPDNSHLYGGTYDDYIEMFTVVYRRLHQAFPLLKVGGPNVMGYDTDKIEHFLKICLKKGVQPDFVAATHYHIHASNFIMQITKTEELLEKYQLPDTEIILSEWHLAPSSWAVMIDPKFKQVDSAAFTASTYIRLLDTKITAAYFYAWQVGSWALIQRSLDNMYQPLPVYYGIKFFTELTDCEKRIACEAPDDIEALAGVTGDTVKLLVSCYMEDTFDIRISLPGYTHGSFKSVANDIGEASDITYPIQADADGIFHLRTETPRMAVVQFTFEK